MLDSAAAVASNHPVLTDDLDFHLPTELIAQQPSAERSASRLLHYRRVTDLVAHRAFADLPKLLRPGDVLVFNDARVVPARFFLRKPTGGRIEGLFLEEQSIGKWRVLLRDAGRMPIGATLHFDAEPGLILTLLERCGEGEYVVELSTIEPATQLLARLGRMPLPPYIKRDRAADARDISDRQRYQTVYARASGSVAAPTAGLHFDQPLLDEIDAAGVTRVMVTLHVGLGTFKPVSVARLEDHAMHRERWEVDTTAAETLNAAQRDGRRIVAVGTTSARVLESHPADVPWSAGQCDTSIFIYPPYRWKRVEALVTNFHLPRSTLVALVAAMVGLDTQRRLYAEAIAQRYRFFSYGDAMFLESRSKGEV